MLSRWVSGWAVRGLLALALLAVGCATTPPETRYYRVAYELPRREASQHRLPYSLAIARFGASDPYHQERLIYRTSAYQLNFYPYDRWESPPVDLVTERVLQHFQASNLFRAVGPYPLDGAADYVLRGRLTQFEEWDAQDGWYAQVEVEYHLLDAARAETVLNRVARGSVRADRRNAEAVVRAMSEALRASLAEMVAGVEAALAARQ